MEEETQINPVTTPEEAPAQAETAGADMSSEKHRSMGPVIGSIIIIAVIVIGGLYLYGQQVVKTEQEAMTAEEIDAMEDQELQDLQTVSDSDDLDSIETDLNANSFNEVDAELDALNNEF